MSDTLSSSMRAGDLVKVRRDCLGHVRSYRKGETGIILGFDGGNYVAMVGSSVEKWSRNMLELVSEAR